MAIVEKMVADVDLDSNGEISFDEFCQMMDACHENDSSLVDECHWCYFCGVRLQEMHEESRFWFGCCECRFNSSPCVYFSVVTSRDDAEHREHATLEVEIRIGHWFKMV